MQNNPFIPKPCKPTEPNFGAFVMETATTPPIAPPHHPTKKTGVLLINMGGPDDQNSVKPFLFNLFSDPDIIKLPISFLFQKLLAFIIVQARGTEAKANYAKMGGGSPQLPITRQQAAALQEALTAQQHDLPVYIAMRYWHPFTEEAINQAVADGIEHLIVVSLYPHFSYTTTGSSLNELQRVLKRKGLTQTLTTSTVEAYYDAPDYLAAWAQCIEDGLAEGYWTCPKEDVRILFSAHSLPIKHVERTKDPYPEQIEGCCEAVIQQFFPNNPWDLAYQSKVGKMPWLGPPTDGLLAFYADKHMDNVLVVPVSFVSDHIETLVELDQEYIPAGRDMGIKHIHRAPVMNTRPGYINLLARLVKTHLQAEPDLTPEMIPQGTLSS